MITVRRDAVRTQGGAPKGGGDQRHHEAVRSSSRLEAHAEVVKCDISATANTLKSQDTPNLLSPNAGYTIDTHESRFRKRHLPRGCHTSRDEGPGTGCRVSQGRRVFRSEAHRPF